MRIDGKGRVLLLSCLLVAPGIAGADTIRLRNGSVLDGDITRETDAYVIMRVRGAGQMRIEKSRITDIARTRTPPADGPKPTARAGAPAPAGKPDAAGKAVPPDPDWRYRHAHRFEGPVSPEVQTQLERISTPGKESVNAVIELREMREDGVAAIPQLLRILADDRQVAATDRSVVWIGYGGHLAGRSGHGAQMVSLAKETAYTLARLGEPALMPTLDALQDAHPIRRAYAAMSLGWNKAVEQHKSEVVRALETRLGDTHPFVRGHAAYTLAVVGPSDAINTILPLLLDSDHIVRRMALRGITFRPLGDDINIDPLLRGLAGPDAAARNHAAAAFAALAGKIKDPRVHGALRRAAEDPDPQVRRSRRC